MKRFFFVLIMVCMCAHLLAEGNLIDQGDVRRARQAANETYGQFLVDTLPQRLTFLSSSHLTDQAKIKLSNKALTASSRLNSLRQNQQLLQNQIENYAGQDWDQRYGQTGLWRQIVADIASTSLLKTQCDYFTALANTDNRDSIIDDIFTACDQLDEVFPTGQAKLLKLKTQALTAPANSVSKQIEDHFLRTDTSTALQIEALALLNRLGWKPARSRITDLAHRLAISPGKNNYEPWLKLSLVALGADDETILNQTLENWPSLHQPLGIALLAKWSARQNPQQATQAEAKLLAIEASRTNASNYTDLLTTLTQQPHLASAVLYYAAAEAIANSNSFKAIELYMRSADKQRQENDPFLALSPAEIAAKGAKCAYQLYYTDQQYLRIACDTLAYYSAIAGDQCDEQLKYLHGLLLKENSESDKANQIFTELQQAQGKYANHAAFELITMLKENLADDPAETQNLRRQLKSLLEILDGDNELERQLRLQATAYYCRWLLEDETADSAQQALQLLKNETADNLKLIRSQALVQLNKLDQAAQILLTCQIRPGEWTATAIETLWRLLEGSEQLFLQDQYRISPPTGHLLKLANACKAHAEPPLRPRALLIWTEITLLNHHATGLDPALQSKIENTMNELTRTEYAQSMNFHRCQARFFTLKKEYTKAQAKWAAIAKARRTAAQPQNPTWQWWRAKYHELENWTLSGKTDENQLTHAIDVLFNSFSEIPEPWAAKFVSLKESGELKA